MKKKLSGVLIFNMILIIVIIVLIFVKATDFNPLAGAKMEGDPISKNESPQKSEISEDYNDIKRHINDKELEDKENLTKQYQSERVYFKDYTFDTFTVNTRRHSLNLYWKQDQVSRFGDIGSLKSYLERHGKRLIFATNSGIYNEDRSPLGLHIQNGNRLVPVNLDDGYGNFYMKPNGVFMLSYSGNPLILPSEDYFNIDNKKIKLATQSGPLLVHNGETHPDFNEGSASKFIRNGVGVIDKDTIVFAISNEPVNFYDFATLFKSRLNCQSALYLDGGISKMYLPELSRLELSGELVGIFTVEE